MPARFEGLLGLPVTDLVVTPQQEGQRQQTGGHAGAPIVHLVQTRKILILKQPRQSLGPQPVETVAPYLCPDTNCRPPSEVPGPQPCPSSHSTCRQSCLLS